MNLITVESPIKANTIRKYLKQLGLEKDFKIFATAGHITELPKKDFAVYRDEKGHFTSNFIIPSSKKKIVSELKSLVKQSKKVYMCQDDDREGERISHDIVEICNIKEYYRVTLLSITLSEIRRAFLEKHGIRLIDEKIVLAQRTRRIIDRIIGYGLSPALSYYFQKNKILSFKKDGRHESAEIAGTGRVIGNSLAYLAKREEDIQKYKERGEIKTDVVKVKYSYNGVTFFATGNNLEFMKKDSETLNRVIAEANSKLHKVYDYQPNIKEVAPYPAFMTSTLYSACSYNYDLLPSQTKKIAQDLFYTGYITYPRTDNEELSNEASEEIISYLMEVLDETEHDDVLKVKRKYKKKKKSFSQDAHEGIRPAFFKEEFSPDKISHVWSNDKNCEKFGNYHKFVYSLIWYRAISTQLIDSVYDVSKIIISAGEYHFFAFAKNRIQDGWERYFGDVLHASDKGRGDDDWRGDPVVIPTNVYVGLVLEDREVFSLEKTSRAPKRISEGALINYLVSNGIARPSTLHTVSKSLVQKKYATSNKTILTPTDIGMAVYEVTEKYLPWINNTKDAQDFEKIIELIEKGDIINVDEVIDVYWSKVEEFKKEIGYLSYDEREDGEPSPEQKEFAKTLFAKLDKEEQLKIDFDFLLSSRKAISKFISNEVNKQKKSLKDRIIGVCPKCDKKTVITDKKCFRCYNRECDFIVWYNSLDSFISRFKVNATKDELMSQILKKNTLELSLVSPRTSEPYKSKVHLAYNPDYKSWNISFL